MTRSQIASKFNINSETLRYYESLGLINPKRDPGSGYRIYSDKELLKLDFITRFKKFGFKLKDIKSFFDFIYSNNQDKSLLTNFLNDHINDIESQIAGLNSLLESLIMFRDKKDTESCSVISRLLDNP